MKRNLLLAGAIVLVLCFGFSGFSASRVWAEDKPLFYASFEDTADAITGQMANLNNTEPDFVPARFGKGLLCDATNKAVVSYPTVGSINKEAGTVEFWVRLMEDATAGKERQHRMMFLLQGTQSLNPGLIFMGFYDYWPSSIGIIRFSINGDAPYADHPPTKEWKKGEMHHLALAWQEKSGVDFYVDGKNVKHCELEDFKLICDPAGFFYIYPTNCVVDELTIYGYRRTDSQVEADFKAKEPLQLSLDAQK